VTVEVLIARGRAAWPELDVSDELLRDFLAERAPVAEDRVADLVLACGLAAQRPAAVAAFTATYDPHIRAIIGRTVSDTTAREEAYQLLLAHLLVPSTGAPPRIAAYRGHGELLAFVRVIAVRVAIGLVRKQRPAEDDDGELAELPAAGADPELVYLKELYRGEFRDSFRAAVAALDKRDRTLLRYHLIDGLSIDKLAGIYHVHRATAARQLADARANLVQLTHRELAARLRIPPDELASVLRLIESQVDVSVRRLLET
jgi:RNA polymerase sigma-70 factor (ECF subfamily)